MRLVNEWIKLIETGFLPGIIGCQFEQSGNFLVEGGFAPCFLFQQAGIACVDVYALPVPMEAMPAVMPQSL